MVDQKIIDEAKAREIVPGAVIKTPTGNEYTQSVRPFEEWQQANGATVWNGSFVGDSICIYDAQKNAWATVITPAPQAIAEGLVEGDAVECGPAMRAAIIELAKELGICDGPDGGLSSNPIANGVYCLWGSKTIHVYADGGTSLTKHTPEAFIAKMRVTAAKPKPIRIGDHEVKFKDNGDIKVGCTHVDFLTLEAVYNKAKQTKQ